MGRSRLLFVPRVLECLARPSEEEARRCLYEADLGFLREFLAWYTTMVSAFYGCKGPYTMIVPSHDRIAIGMGPCRNTEGAVWELHKALEELPGVWYVRSYIRDDGFFIETIPYSELWR